MMQKVEKVPLGMSHSVEILGQPRAHSLLTLCMLSTAVCKTKLMSTALRKMNIQP
jgi:hypothetical protein